MRTFEATDLTKTVLKALRDALMLLEEVGAGCLPSEIQEYKDLLNKIESQKMDIRLVHREE